VAVGRLDVFLRTDFLLIRNILRFRFLDPVLKTLQIKRSQKSKNVLLLEAGPSDSIFSNRLGKLISWKIHMPAALQYNLQDDKLNWYYETIPQKHANNRSFYWPRGRVLGATGQETSALLI
jgi:hypothetical protein